GAMAIADPETVPQSRTIVDGLLLALFQMPRRSRQPEMVRDTPVFVIVACCVRVTCVAESRVRMYVPAGMPVPVTWRPTSVATNAAVADVTTAEPLVVTPSATERPRSPADVTSAAIWSKVI